MGVGAWLHRADELGSENAPKALLPVHSGTPCVLFSVRPLRGVLITRAIAAVCTHCPFVAR